MASTPTSVAAAVKPPAIAAAVGAAPAYEVRSAGRILAQHSGVWPARRSLGRGGHSNVFVSTYAVDGHPKNARPVVVKRIVKCVEEPAHVVANEICVLEHLWPYSDRYLVQFVAALQDDRHYYIVAELAPGMTNMTSYLDRDGSLPLLLVLDDEKAATRRLAEIRRVVTNLVAGLGRLHEIGVAHRDVKPPNILIDESGEIRLIDMGLAVVDHESMPYAATPLGRASPHASSVNERSGGGGGGGGRGGTTAIGHSQTGSQCYWAPEVSIRRRELRYDLADLQRTDWFSLGLVVWQIITNNEYYSACRALHCRDASRDEKTPQGDDGLDEVQRRSLESGTDDDRKCHEIFLMLANSDPYRVTEPMGDVLGPYIAKNAPDLVQLLHTLLSKDPARRTSFAWPLSVPSSSSSSSPSSSSSTAPRPTALSPPLSLASSSSMLSSLQSFISSAASPIAPTAPATPTAVPDPTAPTPPSVAPRRAQKSARRKSTHPTQSGDSSSDGGGGGGGVDAEAKRSENGDEPDGADRSKKTQSTPLLLKRVRVR